VAFNISPATPGDAADTLALIERVEDAAGHEVVDEGERQRVEELADAAATSEVDGAWRPLVARDGHGLVGFASTVLPDQHAGTATGEIVVDPDSQRTGIGTALVRGLEALAADGAGRLSVWARAGDVSRGFASSLGYTVDRQLDILGRRAAPVPEPAPPEGIALRSYRPGDDDTGVVAVLNSAFADHPDPDWTVERLARRRRRVWFDPDGLVVAEDADGIVGVHWTKERAEGVGEVHLLGVMPRAHGTGLGRALLYEGLARMQQRGATDVLLWMEHDNVPARRLYDSVGFEPRWSIASFARDL
jgi:mycothiol synthase